MFHHVFSSFIVVVVGPTPPVKTGGGVQQPFLRTPAYGIPISPAYFHKSVTCSCVFMLVQLNKCVIMCGSDLQRGHSGDGCLSSSILFKYECSRGHFFVPSWARVGCVALGSVVSE